MVWVWGKNVAKEDVKFGALDVAGNVLPQHFWRFSEERRHLEVDKILAE